MDSFLNSLSNRSVLTLVGTILLFMVIYWAVLYVLRKLGKDPKYLLPKGSMKKMALPFLLIFGAILLRLPALRELLGLTEMVQPFVRASTLLLIFAVTWLILAVLKIVKNVVVNRYNVNTADNLKARKIYTQFNILERIVIFIVVILAVGLALMTFDEIREVGISVFASAGVAGIIIGFSAQKLIGTVLAGIQIAIAQPIKLDDVVIVEGEWGRIEEITLTYVVVKVWDKRRLIVPTPYFIETPFQNWTKSSSDILGTVFLHMDYRVPIGALRKELTRILEQTDLWDGQANNIQVTDSKATHMEVRAMMSARDASQAWELRVHVREKLIAYLQKNHPESLPHHRVLLRERDAMG
ncbi:mechanosensitive ion channel family protein [Maribacter sp. 2307ULW6-5]|uniref:mechanosensitive ion channel family protein n=1 Tax=Maribacter sp. 2307ULW6-5 TaxID=3386275 RepID=UPI0039BC3A1C